jgi:hypothetical protein
MDKINKMVSRMAGKKIESKNRNELNNYKIIKRLNIIKKHLSYDNNYVNENLKTPVKYNCDVLVVGGGPDTTKCIQIYTSSKIKNIHININI